MFSQHEKQTLKKRIYKVKLELPPPATVYSDEPDLFTKNDLYYERISSGSLRLRVGGAYLFTVQSWFNRVFTLAHELAHSIDPCELRNIHFSLPAYDRLSACLMSQKIISVTKNRSECAENDQLSETFADWIAVQITSKALKKFATEFDHEQILHAVTNSVKDLCEQEEFLNEMDNTLHPRPEIRIEKVFGLNPIIQEILGCQPSTSAEVYCDFNWTSKGNEHAL